MISPVVVIGFVKLETHVIFPEVSLERTYPEVTGTDADKAPDVPITTPFNEPTVREPENAADPSPNTLRILSVPYNPRPMKLVLSP
jgi:hypothetical protein